MKNTIVIDRHNYVTNALGFCLNLKGDGSKDKKIKYSKIIFNFMLTMDHDSIF